MKILIKNAKIISNGIKEKETMDIFIKNGTIKAIDKKIENLEDEKVEQIIDAKGKLVLPGFIDIESKITETGYENKDNILNLTKVGTKGGYTTIATSSSNKPIVDSKTVAEYIYSKAKDKNNINLYPLGSLTKAGKGEEVAAIGEMVLTGVTAISDGGISIENTEILRDILLYSKMFNITVITSGLDRRLSKGGSVNYGYISTKLGLTGIPREAEEIEISKNIILAKYTDARVHIPFVTTRGSIELIKKAKEDGANITCGTAPHYFTLSDRDIDNYNTFAKVIPPLREEDDILALKEALKDGTIDCISSGHSPVLYEHKNAEFERAKFGITSLETAFNIVNTKLIKEEGFKLQDITILMSKNPANILGLKNKGEIAVGFDADIVILDEEKQKNIEAKSFLSRAKYSPYDGMEVFGEILMTIVSGNVLYDNLEGKA